MDRNAEPETLLRSLAETAARVKAVGASLTPEELRASPEPKGWSANEILWHIRATADAHGRHIARTLDEDEPSWRHVSPRAQMKKSRYDELPFADSCAAFAAQRGELVERLAALPPEAWQRFATVRVPHAPGGKSEWRVTLRARVWGMVDHEEGHCNQMERLAEAVRAGR